MTTSHAFYTKLTAALVFAAMGQVGSTQENSPRSPRPSAKVAATNVEATEEKSADQDSIAGYEQAFPAMGTLVRLKAFHTDRDTVAKAFDAVETEVRRMEGILSDYNPESETSRLSESAAWEPVSVSDELWAMLKASERWYRNSDGAFDASLGRLTQLWRKHRRAKRVPKPENVTQALAQSGWHSVRLLEPQSVQFLAESIKLDFGGIGKGFIVDRAFEVLQSHGVTISLIDISGNMRCGAPPPNREGWLIAVAGLERGGKPLRIISISNKAIATSGDLWQFQVIEGVKRSHILDPKTGWGVAGPIAATVICERAVDADAAATVGCIASAKEAQAVVSKLGGELLIAKLDGPDAVVQVTSPGFPQPHTSGGAASH